MTRFPTPSPDAAGAAVADPPAAGELASSLTHGELHALSAIYGGDALFLLDRGRFAENYRELLEAFTRHWPRTRIAWSYKTNYTPCLCADVDRWGGYAEVVSRMEFDLALKLGVAAERIRYNGPYKRAADVETALTAGAVVNLESPYELETVEALAAREPQQTLRVMLRANLPLDDAGPSRFGLEPLQLLAAFRRLQKLANCQVVGLHCHQMSQGRTPESYGQRARGLIELAQQCWGQEVPASLSIGGGFFSRMSPGLARQFSGRLPSFEQYGQAATRPLVEAFPNGDGPELVLEPGLALSADAMVFAARVMDVKQIRGRRLALVAGSIYDVKPTLGPRTPAMHLVSPHDVPTAAGAPTDLVGYTCMEHDVLVPGYVGPVHVGDFAVFHNMGAYTNVLKPPFINPAAPIVDFQVDTRQHSLARRSETLEDVFATYVQPAA